MSRLNPVIEALGHLGETTVFTPVLVRIDDAEKPNAVEDILAHHPDATVIDCAEPSALARLVSHFEATPSDKLVFVTSDEALFGSGFFDRCVSFDLVE